MPRILLTKFYKSEILNSLFDERFSAYAVDVINTENVAIDIIANQIQPGIRSYIVSSTRAASQVLGLDLKGDFYCVGKTSAQLLTKSGKNVVKWEKSADDLIKFFEGFFSESVGFHFFCSDIRHDTIPDFMMKKGHKLIEIQTYYTRPKIFHIEDEYDAYAFFSPSGVKSFAEQYQIPEKAVIFAIGKTTSDAVYRQWKRPALYSENSDFISLTDLIKKYFHAEK